MELRTDREDGVGPSLDETFSSSCCIVCVFEGAGEGLGGQGAGGGEGTGSSAYDLVVCGCKEAYCKQINT